MDTFHETNAHYMKLIILLDKRGLYKESTVGKTNSVGKCFFFFGAAPCLRLSFNSRYRDEYTENRT